MTRLRDPAVLGPIPSPHFDESNGAVFGSLEAAVFAFRGLDERLEARTDWREQLASGTDLFDDEVGKVCRRTCEIRSAVGGILVPSLVAVAHTNGHVAVAEFCQFFAGRRREVVAVLDAVDAVGTDEFRCHRGSHNRCRSRARRFRTRGRSCRP